MNLSLSYIVSSSINVDTNTMHIVQNRIAQNLASSAFMKYSNSCLQSFYAVCEFISKNLAET